MKVVRRPCGCCGMVMNEAHRLSACPACIRAQAQADADAAAGAAHEAAEAER